MIDYIAYIIIKRILRNLFSTFTYLKYFKAKNEFVVNLSIIR